MDGRKQIVKSRLIHGKWWIHVTNEKHKFLFARGPFDSFRDCHTMTQKMIDEGFQREQ